MPDKTWAEEEKFRKLVQEDELRQAEIRLAAEEEAEEREEREDAEEEEWSEAEEAAWWKSWTEAKAKEAAWRKSWTEAEAAEVAERKAKAAGAAMVETDEDRWNALLQGAYQWKDSEGRHIDPMCISIWERFCTDFVRKGRLITSDGCTYTVVEKEGEGRAG